METTLVIFNRDFTIDNCQLYIEQLKRQRTLRYHKGNNYRKPLPPPRIGETKKLELLKFRSLEEAPGIPEFRPLKMGLFLPNAGVSAGV